MVNNVIKWFAKNGVAANLLMIAIIVAGLYAINGGLILEVFPTIELDVITVRVPFRGATPAEVEESVVVRIEEAIQDVQGIKEIRSTAAESIGTVSLEIENGYEPRDLLDDIKNRVDAITTFPDEIERPVYTIEQRRHEVISLIVAGDASEKDLRIIAERVRDDILSIPGITQVELTGVRPYEISIELSEETLQEYNLTFAEVSTAIRNSSLDLPAGAIKTKGGEILLRTLSQAYTKQDFDNIPIISRKDGTDLRIGDIALVRDDFEETPMITRFNGEPAAILDVYRVGEQNAITVANKIKEYIHETQNALPAGIKLHYWRDRSKIVKSRLKTLVRSAAQGGILVFLLLAMFLRLTVAIWVCIGIPVSFLGALALLPFLGVTINIISLFAFILVLGIVVDDAIVTGENIFAHLKKSKSGEEAAINGSLEVAVPVIFGVLTTVVAFIPLLMLGGRRGPIFQSIPLVVIPVLLFSLIESKLILPSHLKHMRPRDETKENFLLRFQSRFATGLETFIIRFYRPALHHALNWRYVTLAIFLGILAILLSMALGGRIGWTPFPRVEHEVITVTLEMPLGTDFDVTNSYVQRITEVAGVIRDKYVDPTTNVSVVSGILSSAGSSGGRGGKSHLGRVRMQIVPPEERTIDASVREISNEWRDLIGPLPGESKLSIRAEIGHRSEAIDIQLSGTNFKALESAADEIKTFLGSYQGVFDISDSFEGGKAEIRLTIKPEAELLGLNSADLGRQVRQAFFGEEAQRIQRGRDDVRVMIRYPENERKSISTIDSMKIRTKTGVEVPFENVADVEMGRGYAEISRVNRNRTTNIIADVDKKKVNMADLQKDLVENIGKILGKYPSIRFSLEGEAKDVRESTGSLKSGLLLVLFAIYALLAIPFRSYLQPLIVMSVIPFGISGAILGHMLMDMSLSMMSLFGILALVGVVVNDSLVLVDYVNKRRNEGTPISDAVRIAGTARFRPILLTSLTTFAGLTPLILEKSTQAQFLIPMAVSLGFGVLFATLITLFLVPVNYLILEDIRALYRQPANNQKPESAATV